MFQERLFKAIETSQPRVELPPPPPTKHEYLDLAFETMAFKMKKVLLKEEIMDVVEYLQNLMNRA